MSPGSFSAGVPAPGVFGEGTLDGRFGMVLGSPRRTDTTAGHAQRAVTFAQAGAVPASLGLSVHRMSPPPSDFHLRRWMDTAFRLSGDIVPKHIISVRPRPFRRYRGLPSWRPLKAGRVASGVLIAPMESACLPALWDRAGRHWYLGWLPASCCNSASSKFQNAHRRLDHEGC